MFKKKIASKFLSVVVAASVMVGALPMSAYASTKPEFDTLTVTFDSNDLYFNGTANENDYYLQDVGVIYSTKSGGSKGYNINDVGGDIKGQETAVSNSNGTFTGHAHNLDSSATYYITPYIAYTTESDSSDTKYVYEDEFSLEEGSNYKINDGSSSTDYGNGNIDLSTKSATYDSNDETISAKASIDNYNGITESKIDKVGFVYSSTDKTPEYKNSNSDYVTTSISSDDTFKQTFDVDTNVDEYYVASFVLQSNSDVSYGNVVTVDINGDNGSSIDVSLKTNDVTSVGNTSVTANGYYKTKDSNISLKDLGFVYSSDKNKPTTSDHMVTLSSSDLSDYTNSDQKNGFDYSLNINGLDPNTKYYVRAYAKTSDGTVYGDPVSFTTSNSTVYVTINYTTSMLTSVGTQKIDTTGKTKLTTSDLTVPTGYKLQDTNWTYTVPSSSATTNVMVAQTSSSDNNNTNTNTENAYIDETGSYTFSPEAPATRAVVANALYQLSDDKTLATTPKGYTDVNSKTQYEDAINFVTANGYMTGYPDGSFKPTDKITRAEMAEVCQNFYKLSGSATSNYTDVKSSDWFYLPVSQATAAGMLSGYTDGSFKPNNDITRAELCSLLDRAEHRSMKPIGSSKFNDVPTNYWAYSYIMNASVAQ